MEENPRPGHRSEAVRPTITRLLILITLLGVLNALPPVAIWKTSNNALADTTSDRPPSKQQLQIPQRLLRPEIPQQRLQQSVPAVPNTQTDPPPRQQLQTPQRLLRPELIPPRGQQTGSAAPKAEINPPRQVVTQGQPAIFDSKSMADPEMPITVHQWSGPSGQTSNRQRFVVDTTNLKPATYPVTLIVRDRQQRQGLDRATLVVEAKPRDDVGTVTRPPVARISPDRSRVNQGTPVRFFSTSYHPDSKRKIVRTLWQTSWGQRASGDYIEIDTQGLNPGEYSVALTVVDDGRTSDSAKAILLIEAAKALMPPVAIITPDHRSVDQGGRVNFADASYHPNRETRIVSRRWNTQWGQTHGEKTLNVDTAPLPPGTYWITLEVVDQNKKTDRARAALEILRAAKPPEPPIARITPRRIEVQQREPARFDGSQSTDADGTIRAWTWSLNSKAIDQKPSAQIDTRELGPGEYKVRLEVKDDRGLTARDEALLIVVEPARDVDAAIVQLDVWPAPVAPNREVQIRAMVANRGKDALRNLPVRFETGGARIAEKTLASLGGGETQEVTAIWIPKSSGTQSIIATVNPDNQPPESNRANNVSRRAIVVLTAPVIKIAPSPLEVRQGDTAKFTGQAIFPGQQGAREVKYFWRGPGNRTGQGAEFQLDTIELSPGDHKIVLEISDSSGFKATADATLTVRGAKAEVWLAADIQSPETGGDVRFTAGTRPVLKQVQYKFIFGDDKQTEWSAGAEAVHRYEKPGDYTARLLARRSGVDLAQTSIGISVKDIAYAVSLRTETESVRAGDPLAFIANVEPRADDIEYLFRFGDGRDSGWTQSPTASHSYLGDGAYTATVEARIRGSRTIPGPDIRVSVSTPPSLPWFWLGAGLAALAAASAAYMRKTRPVRIDGSFSIVPQLNLEQLHVEAQGKLNSGCAIGLRAVRGQSRFDIEASGPLVDSRN